jgi:hypothetical protein
MTDWLKIASALVPAIPAEDVEKIVPTMDGLERAFEPLRKSIPIGAEMWTPE